MFQFILETRSKFSGSILLPKYSIHIDPLAYGEFIVKKARHWEIILVQQNHIKQNGLFLSDFQLSLTIHIKGK